MEKQNRNTDKLTDKVFSRLIITSVIGILVCIMCLCSATWAWFSTDVSSVSNTLASGNFGLIVSISETSATVSEKTDGSSVALLGDADTYTVTLKISEDTTVSKGYCIIKVNGTSYYTDSINAVNDSFTFTIDAKEAGMTVTFSSAWGFPSAEDLIEMNEVLTIGAESNS